jgi:TatD DNase family protein
MHDSGMTTADWIDTHCHLDASEFDADRDQVLARARAAGVAMQVLPAVDAGSFDAVRELAHAQGLAYALGIHPLYVDRAAAGELERLEQMLIAHRDDPRLVAVGEIGLDFFVSGSDPARQEVFYLQQLRLAQRFGLPVIVHVRRSADALLKGLRRVDVAGGIVHAFNGSRQQADAFLGRGFALGFGGAMTFERALQIRRLAAGLPADALVLETDSPDIAPQWLHRSAGERADGARSRNEPGELPRIAATLAQLRACSLDEIAATTGANARRVLPGLDRLRRIVAGSATA